MARSFITTDCPCCGKRIEINPKTGRARAVQIEDAMGGKGMDDLIDMAKNEGSRLDNLLGRAKDEQSDDAARLEDMFGIAKDKAEDEPNEKPRNPFDLD